VSGKVLIVDDDPTVRESLRDRSERPATPRLFSMASSLESGLIVMDRMMPRMDGVEANPTDQGHPAAHAGHPAVRAALKNVRSDRCGTST
jgi:CheY-like chemotaxis protein